jgi:hypothetical protein
MEHHELVDAQRERSVSVSIVVGELDLKGAGAQFFHQRADLPAAESPFGNIRQQRNYVQYFGRHKFTTTGSS